MSFTKMPASLVVKKNILFIRFLSETDDKQRDALLKTINKDQMEVLRQIVRNVLEGGLVLTNQGIKELRHYENKLINFADSKEKGRRKKHCLQLKKVWSRLIKAVLPQLELLE